MAHHASDVNCTDELNRSTAFAHHGAMMDKPTEKVTIKLGKRVSRKEQTRDRRFQEGLKDSMVRNRLENPEPTRHTRRQTGWDKVREIPEADY